MRSNKVSRSLNAGSSVAPAARNLESERSDYISSPYSPRTESLRKTPDPFLELKRQLAVLEDLSGRLGFLLQEVESVVKRSSKF